MLQFGYVGSQGHRLLASHDVNYGNAQTCLDLQASRTYATGDRMLTWRTYTCGQFYADSAFQLPGDTIPRRLFSTLQNHGSIPSVGTPWESGITLVGLRPVLFSEL